MRPKHLVSIVLIAVVLVMLMRNNNSMTNARPLVYRESLDEVAAQINGYQMFWSHQKLLYQSAYCGDCMTVHRTAVCNAGSC